MITLKKSRPPWLIILVGAVVSFLMIYVVWHFVVPGKVAMPAHRGEKETITVGLPETSLFWLPNEAGRKSAP